MGLFSWKKKKELPPERPAYDAEKLQAIFIRDMTANAERLAQAFNPRFNGAFDYTGDSLLLLDKLMDEFSTHASKMDPRVMQDMIAQAGAYLFEVARRKFGGVYVWFEERHQPVLITGLPDYQVTILAFAKIKDRIENGLEDSIPVFFQQYTEKVTRAKPGDKITIE
ncbi:MAG: hypothetical protein J0M30_02895 [Chitinophagales bacterium]|nr:hypothetical protein [Chitinophagales bacterium]